MSSQTTNAIVFYHVSIQAFQGTQCWYFQKQNTVTCIVKSFKGDVLASFSADEVHHRLAVSSRSVPGIAAA